MESIERFLSFRSIDRGFYGVEHWTMKHWMETLDVEQSADWLNIGHAQYPRLDVWDIDGSLVLVKRIIFVSLRLLKL
jgi:hypothetical protein